MSIATRNHDHVAADAGVEDSDEALLYAFVTCRDDLAFAQVVTRYAGLVMGVCRRVLGNEQDAEDAFQATFLVLARKANSLRDAKSLPAWLHKTAHRISLRARSNKARRREQSLEPEVMVEDQSTLRRIATDHERSTLDEELNRLPERYRLPLFLCCLEGKSRDEAARQLGWSSSSLKGRLERARQLLRRRLILRGVSLGAAAALVMRMQSVAQAAVPPDVVASTVQAGMRYASGQPPIGYVSPHAHQLANWSLQAMSITSAKFVVCSLLVVGTLTLGSRWMVVPAAAEGSGGDTIAVQPTTATSSELTFVAYLADDREEPARDGERRDGDKERERERPREVETRREGDRPRETETRREGERPRETEQRREGEPRGEGFRPQTDSEAALYRMIVQLRREVEELRHALRARGGEARRDVETRERERDQPRRESDRPRERDGERPAPPREGERESQATRESQWQNTKEGKIFQAYDKNGDLTVSLEEWLAMKEGEMTDERRALETRRFNEMEPSGDSKFTLEEFLRWYRQSRSRNDREGEREADER